MARRSTTAFTALLLAQLATAAAAQSPEILPPIDPGKSGSIADRYAQKGLSPQNSRTANGYNSTSVFAILGVGLAGLVAAAASTGGGDNEGGAVDPETPAPPAPAPGLTIEQIESGREYRINPALLHANASHKYLKGLTGKGVVIGVMDNGIQDIPELAGAVDRTKGYSPFGTGHITDETNPVRHGTAVAQIIAGRKNDQGSHGVAYEATILDLTTGTEETDVIDPEIRGGTAVFTPGITAGLNGGARLFNASFGYPILDDITQQTPDGYRFSLRQFDLYDGFQQLADNDAVFVVSTGNDGTFDPSTIAAAGILPEFSGNVIAVTSLDKDGNISSFANRCGVLQDFCLGAVGEFVPVMREDGNTEFFSGTSASAPVVTGSIALLKQEFPELSYPDTAKIVLDTARDLGAPGTDAVYGRGALDLENAFSAQGNLRIAAQNDVRDLSYSAQDSVVRTTGALSHGLIDAFNDTTIMVYDRYTRGFDARLDAFVAQSTSDSPLTDIDVAIGLTNGVVARSFGEDGTLAAAQWGIDTYALGYGRADVFAAATKNGAIRKDYSALGAFDDAFNASWRKGDGVVVGAHFEPGHGGAIWMDAPLGRHTRFGAGLMSESEHVLGSSFAGAMGDNGDARTVFADIATTYRLSERWTMEGEAVLAHTRFEQDGIFQAGRLTSASAQISLDYKDARDNIWTGFIGTPLTVHDGSLTLDLPGDRLPGEDDNTSTGLDRVAQNLSLDRAKTPIDFGLGYTRLIQQGQLSATAGVRVQDSDTDPFAGLAFALRF